MEHSYHHGDLRQALIDAALDITADRGGEALTMRQVARDVGVSHAAPYHHFSDRAGLLAAVAEQGFRWLAERISEVEGDPSTILREAGVAYVVFAVQNPELFRLMFSREIAISEAHPGLGEAVAAAKDGLAGAIEACNISDGGPPQREFTLVVCWAMVHGLATLTINGQLSRPGTDADVAARMSRESLDCLWRGLASGN